MEPAVGREVNEELGRPVFSERDRLRGDDVPRIAVPHGQLGDVRPEGQAERGRNESATVPNAFIGSTVSRTRTSSLVFQGSGRRMIARRTESPGNGRERVRLTSRSARWPRGTASRRDDDPSVSEERGRRRGASSVRAPRPAGSTGFGLVTDGASRERQDHAIAAERRLDDPHAQRPVVRDGLSRVVRRAESVWRSCATPSLSVVPSATTRPESAMCLTRHRPSAWRRRCW